MQQLNIILEANCLPLISFELRKRKKVYKFSSSWAFLHISAKFQRDTPSVP